MSPFDFKKKMAVWNREFKVVDTKIGYGFIATCA